MARDPGLKQMAFSFVRVSPRSSKPRQAGLTVVADRGMGSGRLVDLIESASEYIDYFKLGIGAYRLQTERLLKRKIGLLREAGIRTFFAGDVTAAAFQQGVSRQFYREAKRQGYVASLLILLVHFDHFGLNHIGVDAFGRELQEARIDGVDTVTKSCDGRWDRHTISS